MASVQKISPFLMFDGPVEEAAKFYVSVFPNSEIKSANPMSATIVANGTEILMFNGGPHFKFSPGISFFVKCKDQAEVDLYWNTFIDGGGREDNCGWLQDKWGVSWQIIPDALGRYLGDTDREKANRVMQAMFKMKKIIVADLDRAAAVWFTLTENERKLPMTTSINDKAQVSLPSDTEVRVTRDFKAPRKLVWQAHTVPELFQRWIGGYPGWSMPVCEMDVRPGGTYRWHWRSDEDGKEFGFHGVYREIDAPARMVQAEYYDPGSFGGAMATNQPAIIRTTFTETNGITTLVTLMDYGSKEARDAAIATGMTDGMETSYERLDKLLAEQRGG